MSSKNNYFDEEEVSQAIIEYNEAESDIERSRIYREHIQESFSKLAEYMVNMHFDHYSTTKQDFMQRIETHLSKSLDGFDPEKGRAFSYYSFIAYNHGLRLSKKNYKRNNEYSSLDNEDFYYEPSVDEEGDHERSAIQHFFDEYLKHWEDNIHTHFESNTTIRVAEALLDVFKKVDNIERFNKRDIYVMIREQSGIEDVKYITPVVRTFREHYEKHIKRFRKTGEIDFSSENSGYMYW